MPVNLDTLKLYSTALDEYNKGWGKRRVNAESYLFERLSRYIMNEGTINKYLQGNHKTAPGLSGRGMRTWHRRMPGTPIQQWPTMRLR